MRQTYRRYGFLVSAVVHVSLLGGVVWLLFDGTSSVPQETREVPVALSMFVPEAAPAAPAAESRPVPAAPVAGPEPAVEAPPPVEPEPLSQPPPPTEPAPTPRPAPAEAPPPARSVPPTPRPREPRPHRSVPPADSRPSMPQAAGAEALPATRGELESGRVREAAKAAYLARLQAAIGRHKYYPRRSRIRGEEGRVLLQLSIAADGSFSEIRVLQSSGSRRLDEAALRAIRRVGHADPLPGELGLSAWRISVPMVFSLN